MTKKTCQFKMADTIFSQDVHDDDRKKGKMNKDVKQYNPGPTTLLLE